MITTLPDFIERFNTQPACKIVPKKELNDLPINRRASCSQTSFRDNCEKLAQQIKQQQQGRGITSKNNYLAVSCNNILRCASGFEPATLLSQWLKRVDIITALRNEREKLINERLGEEEITVSIT